jgi:NAD(P)H dehydrogenase (quinone)
MIAVTGATGQLGRLVVAGLLEKIAAKDLVVVVRTPSKAADLAAKGVQVRQADYSQPGSFGAALQGVTKLLLISSSEVGQRAPQHQAVITAAKAAGVKFIAYTSILHGDRSKLALAAEHVATEKALTASGLAFALLRNGWYLENYTDHLATSLAHGFAGSAGTGRIAAAARKDYAAAAVAVLTTEGQAGKVYELAGDQPFTMAELAAETSKQTGKALAYANLPPEQFKGVLTGAGLPGVVADIFVDADVNIVKGELDDSSKTLSTLIGRPTTSLADAVKAGLARLKA